MTPLIELRHLSKRFLLRHNRAGELKVRFLGLFHKDRREVVAELWAVKDVSLTIGRGESIGLIGRNGSGKSTLLKLVAGIHRPTSGHLLMPAGCRVGTLIELGVGFHPELSGRENVCLNAAIHGLSRDGIDALVPRVVDYSGLAEFMDVPLKNYSSGMQMRLGFAVAANLDPDVLLLDEIFAVGDEDFQKRCHRTLRRFLAQGKTILFVSHASAAVRGICQRVCLLEHGELLHDGDVDSGLAAYQRLMIGPSADVQPAEPPRASEGTDTPMSSAGASSASADLDLAWHRVAVGGLWEELGARQFEFLKAEGLRPEHRLLDVGCGSLRAGLHLIPYLEPGHYVGLDSSEELIRAGIEIELPRTGCGLRDARFIVNDRFDLSGLPEFDFALAHSLFPHVSLNTVAVCVASVVRKLSPTGRFYASYFEAPECPPGQPFVHVSGVTTYPDAEPYHVDFAVLAAICDAVGAHAERLGEWGHPRGQVMMVITRKRDAH